MENKSAVVSAPAKINLALAIHARRNDGYHSMETVFQSVSLSDRVKVAIRKKQGITCLCGGLSGEGNLAYRAAKLFIEQFKTLESSAEEAGVQIKIEKRIPVQAGLAGGSTDAAAVLRALNYLFDYPFSYNTLIEIAKKCGSDTPFCLKGGTQWGAGTGTDLEELPPAPAMDILIVKPYQGISTVEAYRVFDEIGEYASLNKNLWIDILNKKDIVSISQELSNSLEKAAFKLLPDIIRIKQVLLAGGALGALMSGSGSAVFGIVQDKKHGRKIAKLLADRGFKETWLVQTVNT